MPYCSTNVLSVSPSGLWGYNYFQDLWCPDWGVLVYIEPEKFTEKTDIEMRVESTATGATGAAFATGFDIALVDNN